MSGLNITICGCGNGAHACAAIMSLKGHSVNIYSPLKEEIRIFEKNYQKNGGLDAQIVEERVKGLKLNRISDDPSQTISGAAIIFVIAPAFAHKTIFRHIRNFIEPEALVAILPSRGLIELELKEFIPKVQVMAFQTLPWSCRMENPGSEVTVKGIKKKVQIASNPADLSPVFFHMMEELLDMRVEHLKSMLTLTLANMGQIFHPGIMYGLFKEDPCRIFSLNECPFFYQGVSAEGAEILSGMAGEIHRIGEAMLAYVPDLELECVLTPEQWLIDSYSDVIADKTSLQTMLNTNHAYQGIRVPIIKVGENRYQADFHARYVVEDIPYSLLVSRSLGKMLCVETPVMDQVITKLGSWVGYPYLKQCREAEEFSKQSRLPVFYGMETILDVVNF